MISAGEKTTIDMRATDTPGVVLAIAETSLVNRESKVHQAKMTATAYQTMLQQVDHIVQSMHAVADVGGFNPSSEPLKVALLAAAIQATEQGKDVVQLLSNPATVEKIKKTLSERQHVEGHILQYNLYFDITGPHMEYQPLNQTTATGMMQHDQAAINSEPQPVKYSKEHIESAGYAVAANTFSAPSTTGEVAFSQQTVSAAPTTSDAMNASAPVVGNVHHTQATLPNSEIAGGMGAASVSSTPVSNFSAPTTTATNVQPVVGQHTAHVTGVNQHQHPVAHVHHNIAGGTGYSAPTGTGPIGHFTSSYANNVSAGERTP